MTTGMTMLLSINGSKSLFLGCRHQNLAQTPPILIPNGIVNQGELVGALARIYDFHGIMILRATPQPRNTPPTIGDFILGYPEAESAMRNLLSNLFDIRPKVFISFRPNENASKNAAAQIHRHLKWCGVKVFIQEAIPTNLEKKQAARRNFILILEASSLSSQQVRQELEAARNGGLHKIAVVLKNKGGTANVADFAKIIEYNSDHPSFAAIKKALRPRFWRWLLVMAVPPSSLLIVAMVAMIYLLASDGDTPPPPTPDSTQTALAMVPSLTPSYTLNPDEQVVATVDAAGTQTSVAIVVGTSVSGNQTQAAINDANAASQTVMALPPTESDGGAGGDGENSITPEQTLTPTPTSSNTPNWEATVLENLTETAVVISLSFTPTATATSTRTPHRVTATSTASPSATPSATQRPPSGNSNSQPAVGPTRQSPTWTPSLTPTASSTPNPTVPPSPTAPTAPPVTAVFGATPAIIFNPSQVSVAVYAGPSVESGIIGFLPNTHALVVLGEVPEWYFIGFGWVRKNLVLPLEDEAIIPIFQTQIVAYTPAPTTTEDAYVDQLLQTIYPLMTQAAATRPSTIKTQVFILPPAGQTLLAPPTHTPTRTPSATPSRTPTRTSTATATPTRTATFTPSWSPSRTPSPTATTSLGIAPEVIFNPPQYGCVITGGSINVRQFPDTNSPIVRRVAANNVVTLTGQQGDWYSVGDGWIRSDLLSRHATETAAQAQCASAPPPPNPGVTPPTAGPPPTPGPSPTPEPFSIQIIGVSPGAYVEGSGCYANFVVRITGIESISVSVYSQNGFYGYPGNLEATPTLVRGDNSLGVTLGGDQNYRDHTINLLDTSGSLIASAGARCND